MTAIDFFDGLEEDNSREYWLAHKAVYDEAVRAPMERAAGRAGRRVRRGEDLPPEP